jgi:hypothetical protein
MKLIKRIRKQIKMFPPATQQYCCWNQVAETEQVDETKPPREILIYNSVNATLGRLVHGIEINYFTIPVSMRN